MVKTEKITRDVLRSMKDGDVVSVQCVDGYDLDSQRQTAYSMGKIVNCRFACYTSGLILTVTRHDNKNEA